MGTACPSVRQWWLNVVGFSWNLVAEFFKNFSSKTSFVTIGAAGNAVPFWRQQMQSIWYFEHCTTLVQISLPPAEGSSAVTSRCGATQPPSLSAALVINGLNCSVPEAYVSNCILNDILRPCCETSWCFGSNEHPGKAIVVYHGVLNIVFWWDQSVWVGGSAAVTTLCLSSDSELTESGVIRGKRECLERSMFKCLCVTQIPHTLSWDWTKACELKSGD